MKNIMVEYACLKDNYSQTTPGKCPKCGKNLSEVFSGSRFKEAQETNKDDPGFRASG